MTKEEAQELARKSIYCDPDGWWADFPSGWCEMGNPGCHGVHEDTKTEVRRGIRDMDACACADCRGGEACDAESPDFVRHHLAEDQANPALPNWYRLVAAEILAGSDETLGLLEHATHQLLLLAGGGPKMAAHDHPDS